MKHLKIITILLISLFCLGFLGVLAPKVGAVTTYNIWFSVSGGFGNNEISWVDRTTGGHNGYTNTTQMATFNAGDLLTVTATADTNQNFLYFTYQDASGSGNLGNVGNMFRTTAIAENFNLTAVFQAVTVYHTVTVLDDAAGGSQIGWTQGTHSGGVGQYIFADGVMVTFTGGAESGYGFAYFEIQSGTSNGITPGYPIGTLALQVTSDFTIISHASYLPAATYSLTVIASTGGSINWNQPGNATTYSIGNYVMAANTTIQLNAVPSSGYVFRGFDDYLGGSLGTSNPSTFTLTRNMTVYGVFETDEFDFHIIGATQTGLTYTIQQNGTYQCYVDVFSNGTGGASGDYVVYMTPVSNNQNAQNYFQVVNQTRFTSGSFQFAINSQTTTATDLYQNIIILVFWDGVTYNGYVWSSSISIFDLGASLSNFFTSPWLTLPQLTNIPTMGVSESANIQIHYLPYYGGSSPTPTPGPTTDFWGAFLSWFWSATAKLIYGLIVFIVLPLGCAFLLRKGGAMQGMMVGLLMASVINLLAFSFPIYTLIITVIAALVLLFVRS